MPRRPPPPPPLPPPQRVILLLLSPGAQGECRHFASPQALLGPFSLALSPAAGPPQPQAGLLGELTVLLVGGHDLESESLLLASRDQKHKWLLQYDYGDVKYDIGNIVDTIVITVWCQMDTIE